MVGRGHDERGVLHLDRRIPTGARRFRLRPCHRSPPVRPARRGRPSGRASPRPGHLCRLLGVPRRVGRDREDIDQFRRAELSGVARHGCGDGDESPRRSSPGTPQAVPVLVLWPISPFPQSQRRRPSSSTGLILLPCRGCGAAVGGVSRPGFACSPRGPVGERRQPARAGSAAPPPGGTIRVTLCGMPPTVNAWTAEPTATVRNEASVGTSRGTGTM